ncbi:hypothetical protein GCM10022265_36260 [Marinobacter xestospongiae]
MSGDRGRGEAVAPELTAKSPSPSSGLLSGLALRTLLLSLLLVGVTLGAILLALHAFGQYRDTIAELDQQQNRGLATAHLLLQQTEGLVSSSSLLLLASTHFQRREAMFEIADRAEWVGRLVNQLAALRGESSRVDDILAVRQQLMANVAAMQGLVHQRIDLRAALSGDSPPSRARLEQLADVEMQLAAIIRDNRLLSRNLGISVGYHVTAIREQVQGTIGDLNADIARLETLLKASAVAVILAVLLLLGFIQFGVVRRLRRLQASLSRPRPLPEHIEVRGGDEVAHMGAAIRRYVHSINLNEQRILEMNRELNFLATHDSLTRLHNRHYFEQALKVHGEAPQGSTLCVALMDIDHFKAINDSFGHDAGDRVLQHIARLIRRELPDEVLVARYGGEEFALLARDVPFKALQRGLDVLRREIAAMVIEVGSQRLAVTISIGLAQQQPGCALATTVKVADERLYQAKNAGRNRLVAHSPRPSGNEVSL